MKNMSDGKTDGFVLMYCQNGVIYPVGLIKEDFEMLDLTIGMSIKSITIIKDKPQGNVINYIK